MSLSHEERGRGIALIGYRGTGKTTVGRLLADGLGRPFVDADHHVEAIAGRPVAAIFREDGEPAFRDREARAIRDLTGDQRLVLATGGGAILRAENREALRRFGFVAWLTADPTVLADRLRGEAEGRPALTAAGTLGEIAEVLAARIPHYRAVADAVVATDGRSPAEVADEVRRALGHFLKGRGEAGC